MKIAITNNNVMAKMADITKIITVVSCFESESATSCTVGKGVEVSSEKTKKRLIVIITF